MNFDFVADNIAVGSTPEIAADIHALIDKGITHVLNCRDDRDDAPLLVGSNIDYLWNGTPDWTPAAALGLEPKPTSWFAASLNFWLNAPPSKSKRYVHCSAGVNRSATTAWMLLRSLRLKAADCDYIIDSNRWTAVFGIVADHPWRRDAEKALRELGYLD